MGGFVRRRLFFFLLPPFSPSVLGYPREIYRPSSFSFSPFPQLFSQAKQRGRKRRQFLIFWEELRGLSDRAGEFVPQKLGFGRKKCVKKKKLFWQFQVGESFLNGRPFLQETRKKELEDFFSCVLSSAGKLNTCAHF